MIYSVADVIDIVEYEGLEFALKSVRAAEIQDPEVATAWQRAASAVAKLNKLLDEHLLYKELLGALDARKGESDGE